MAILIKNNHIIGSGASSQNEILPEATADNVGKIVQYTGETTDKLTNGFFYKVTDVSTDGTPVYDWEQVNFGDDIIYFESKNAWETAKIAGELDPEKYYGYPEPEVVEEETSASDIIYNGTSTSLGNNVQDAIDQLHFNNHYTATSGYGSMAYYSQSPSSGEYVFTYLSPRTTTISNTKTFLSNISTFITNGIPNIVTNLGGHIMKLYTKVSSLAAADTALAAADASLAATDAALEARIKALEDAAGIDDTPDKAIKMTLGYYGNADFGALNYAKIYDDGKLIDNVGALTTQKTAKTYNVKQGSSIGIELSSSTKIIPDDNTTVKVNGALRQELAGSYPSSQTLHFVAPSNTNDLQVVLYYSAWVEGLNIGFTNETTPINVITGSLK